MSHLRAAAAPDARVRPGHRAIWRWHFYAGLLCLPFVPRLATIDQALGLQEPA